ncbi:2'-5' RNA ligase family protein [Patescibacteria group bacterium]|nr:2'-5' RNA ligase family protein [Patescibacteria group bacterium]
MKFSYKKIFIPTILQPDTIVAVFLLKKFGKKKYPGIENAEIEVRNILPENETSDSLFKKGFFLIDIGGGKFDHHFKHKTVSQLIAEDLKISNDPSLAKLLTFAERDDKYGMGTISKDPIDKAFGLSGLISNVNKILGSDPNKVIDVILPVIHAHYLEEKRRHKDLPEEFKKKSKEKKAEVFFVKQKGKKLKVVAIESDNPSIVGWLRSSIGERADVVLQKASSGHVNIITRPLKRVDLRLVIGLLRQEEIEVQNREISFPPLELMKPGRLPKIPEWYYDLATNSILNGGVNPKGTPSTAIPFEKIKEIVKEGLGGVLFRKKAPVRGEGTKYFLEVRVPLEIAKKIREKIESTPAGIKLHLAQNYHITLIYLGAYEPGDLSNLFEKTQAFLKKIEPFSIEINSKSLKSGIILGYETRAFYFLIPEKKGGEILKKIRPSLEKIIPQFQPVEFLPHLTIAITIPGIEEKVIKEAKIEFKKDFKIKFLVNKIRLTEIIQKPNGQIVYKSKHYFSLKA